MTLTQLRYIVAVDQYKTFARAAKSLFIAQPTLSLQIQKLEQEIGREIFDRRKNPVVATKYGRQVIDQAKVVLREAGRLTEMFSDGDGEPSGQVTVGIIPTISVYLIPKIFNQLSAKYPKADFRFFELPTSQIVEKMERDEIEIGIAATPLQIKDIVETPLYYEPFVAYFPKNFEGKRTGLKMADLQPLNLLLLGEEHCFRNQALKVCGQSTLGKIECGSFETIKKMVDAGNGMTLLPILSINPESNRIGRFARPEPAREVSLIYRKGFFKKKLFNALKDSILKVIPEDLQTNRNRKMIGVDSV